MKIVDKIIKKQNDNKNNPGVTIAFLGDSVTQGCFEVYKKGEGIETVFDKNCAYHKYFAQIFEVICPNVPFNIINAGISGATATFSLAMIDELVLKHRPDLTVVCFGLNDSMQGKEKVNEYVNGLSQIFDKLNAIDSEIIFMTPNMACNEISPHINDDLIREIAERWCENQNSGNLDLYMNSALKLCNEKHITVCDCYKKWKKLSQTGINITELLSNKINHPLREMNRLFAYSLAETIFDL